MPMDGLTVFAGKIDWKKRVDPWTYLAENKRTIFLQGPIIDGVPVLIGGVPFPHMTVVAVADLMLSLPSQIVRHTR